MHPRKVEKSGVDARFTLFYPICVIQVRLMLLLLQKTHRDLLDRKRSGSRFQMSLQQSLTRLYLKRLSAHFRRIENNHQENVNMNTSYGDIYAVVNVGEYI